MARTMINLILSYSENAPENRMLARDIACGTLYWRGMAPKLRYRETAFPCLLQVSATASRFHQEECSLYLGIVEAVGKLNTMILRYSVASATGEETALGVAYTRHLAAAREPRRYEARRPISYREIRLILAFA
jgi:hypothetical protein